MLEMSTSYVSWINKPIISNKMNSIATHGGNIEGILQ